MSASRSPRRITAIITFLVCVSFLGASSVYLYSLSGAISAKTVAADWISGLSAQRYFKHVSYLASDELKGRGDGTPELETGRLPLPHGPVKLSVGHAAPRRVRTWPTKSP